MKKKKNQPSPAHRAPKTSKAGQMELIADPAPPAAAPAAEIELEPAAVAAPVPEAQGQTTASEPIVERKPGPAAAEVTEATPAPAIEPKSETEPKPILAEPVAARPKWTPPPPPFVKSKPAPVKAPEPMEKVEPISAKPVVEASLEISPAPVTESAPAPAATPELKAEPERAAPESIAEPGPIPSPAAVAEPAPEPIAAPAGAAKVEPPPSEPAVISAAPEPVPSEPEPARSSAPVMESESAPAIALPVFAAEAEPAAVEPIAEFQPGPSPTTDLKPEPAPAAAPPSEVKVEPLPLTPAVASTAPETGAESPPPSTPVLNLAPSSKPAPLTKPQRIARSRPTVSKPVSIEKAEAKAAAESVPAEADPTGIEDASPRAPEITGYEFLRLIERTSSGEVWMARRRSARLLAVQVVPRDRFASEAAFETAFEAVRAYEPLSRAHHGFAAVLQSGSTSKCLYYTTALADDLKTRRALPADCPQPLIEAYTPRTLQNTIANRGTLPAEGVLRLGISLAATLQTLHQQGRAYGVVRPERIVFISSEPKLGGPAFEALEGMPAARTRDAYVAPEGAGTPPADLYSLGQVLHEASKEREDSPPGPEAATGVSWLAQWRRVLAKACAESPTRRYQTAQEFQEELAGLLSLRLAERRFWTPKKLLALAALLVAVGAAVAIQLRPSKPAAPMAASADQTTFANSAKEPAASSPPGAAAHSDDVATASPPAKPLGIASAEIAPSTAGVPVSASPSPTLFPEPPMSAAGPSRAPVAGDGLPGFGKAGDPALTATGAAPVTATGAAPAAAANTTQELAALTSAVPTSEPAAPPPEPMQPGQPWTNSLGMKFVPVGEVNFCVWETRVKDYEAFAKATRRFRERALYEATGDHPVVKVSWADARAFCAWLTQKETVAGILAEGHSYRLPTDLEWSRAAGLSQEAGKTPEARDGGIKKTFPWGSSWPPTRGAGNFADTAAKREQGSIISGYTDGFARTAPVGSFRSNRAGLFDLAGNVWEWCEETYSPGGTYRVARGGSCADAKPSDLSSSYRNPVAPDTRSLLQGFRCVLAKPAP